MKLKLNSGFDKVSDKVCDKVFPVVPGLHNLLAHSLGTKIVQDYLNSSKKRARGVGHYVNLDGFPAPHLPQSTRRCAGSSTSTRSTSIRA